MQISVIIPAYNHDMYINAAIKSVVEQSFDDFELIVINDGSTDKTEDAILEFNDKRIKYISQKNRGAHNTINKGIEIAESDYISILNSDDLYCPDRLEKCLHHLEKNRDTSVVITEVEGITTEGIPITYQKTPPTEAWLKWYEESLEFFEHTDFLLCSFAKNLLITTSNYFMRKSVFQKVGKFRGLRYAHDWDMLLRTAQHCKVHLMRDVQLKYRIHEANTIHEDNSEAKVKFEVNWLIADNIRRLRKKIDVFKLAYAIKRNHYIHSELLSLLLMINNVSPFEKLLDFQNATTLQMMELLS